MNKIQKAIKNQEEYVENYETESAPSGEWAEYNCGLSPRRRLFIRNAKDF